MGKKKMEEGEEMRQLRKRGVSRKSDVEFQDSAVSLSRFRLCKEEGKKMKIVSISSLSVYDNFATSLFSQKGVSVEKS